MLSADLMMTNPISESVNSWERLGTVQSKMSGTAKKTDLGLLEEDDEFEEFPTEGISLLFLTESLYSLEVLHGSR